MKERPIIFNAEMVKAILDGRKSQTRRVVKPQFYSRADWSHNETDKPILFSNDVWCDGYGVQIRCPYGALGDRLWVRETIRAEELESGLDGMRYLSDGAFIPIENSPEASDRWCALNHHDYKRRGRGATVPSIFMPRWASRINLLIKSVKVERVQDISEEDARAEGVAFLFDEEQCNSVAGIRGTKPEDHGYENYLWHGHRERPTKLIDEWEHQYSNYESAIDSFSSLWQLINAKRGYGWNMNPWVWAIEFERLGEQ